jgi:hypothetical protein
MNYSCGIYGFKITKAVELGDGIKIIPRTSDYDTVLKWSKSTSVYYRTAEITGDCFSDDFLCRLRVILSFIEKNNVIVSSPRCNLTAPEHLDEIPLLRAASSSGAIGVDVFYPRSNEIFIRKAFDMLENSDKTKFDQLLFKYVESFLFNCKFIDVSYFLLFSGLEAFVRNFFNDEKTDIGSLLRKYSKIYGFQVLDTGADPIKLASSYARLRNKLFHNCRYEDKANDTNVFDVQLTKYLPHFSLLVELIIIKEIGYEDTSINWNRWVDFQ